MATFTLVSSTTLTATSSSASNGVTYISPGYQVTWSNFGWGSDSITVTLPAVLRRASTKINSVTLTGSLGSGYLDPSYDNTTYLNKIKNCQANGVASFTIVYSYKYNTTDTEYYASYSDAAAGAKKTKNHSTKLTNFSITVDYTDFENTISGVGSFDITPSTSKVLGGKSTLGLTVRILPSAAIGAGELAFKVYPEGKSSSGLTFTNPSALAAGTEVTYTNTATAFGVVDSSNLSATYAGKVDVYLNNVQKGSTIDWTSRLQIKSGYESVSINSNGMHTWSDTQGYFSTYSAFIAGRSTSQVTIDSTKYSYDNFLGDNSVTITLNLSNSTTQYSQTYTLANGVNTFTCPPSVNTTDSTVYNYLFTITDAYSGTATYPASGTAAIRVLSYEEPTFSSDFNIYRYLIDSLTLTEVIDDEGTYGKISGDIIATKFQQYGTAPNQTATNSITMTVAVTSTDDSSFGQTLPYTCYSVDFANLTPVNDTYSFDTHIGPVVTGGAYKTGNTYNFTVTLTDGVMTKINSYQFTLAKSYFLIESDGVTVGKGYDSLVDGNKSFTVNYPANIASINQFYGRDYDTGWVNLNNSTYLATGNYGPWNTDNQCPYIRRIGKIIYLRGGLKVKTGKSIPYDSYLGAFHSLPEQFQPDGNFDIPVAADNGSCWLRIGYNMNNGNLKIDPAGIVVRNRLSTTVSEGQYVSIACCYPGKD